METREAIVVDENGIMMEYVLADTAPDGATVPQYYKMEQGELLVFENVQDALSKRWSNDYPPMWNGNGWELSDVPIPPQPSENYEF